MKAEVETKEFRSYGVWVDTSGVKNLKAVVFVGFRGF